MEIERKFLLKQGYDFNEIIKGLVGTKINDFYFNPTTRFRVKDDKFYITVKSLVTLEREEFEFEVAKENVKYSFFPTLRKDRYYVDYKDHTFEINVYQDLKTKQGDVEKPLVMIEVELKNKDEQLELPDWVGSEITEKQELYGFSLFKFFAKSIEEAKKQQEKHTDNEQTQQKVE